MFKAVDVDQMPSAGARATVSIDERKHAMPGLSFNLNRTTSRQLIEKIQNECSRYGDVRSVSLHGFPVLGAQFQPFAVVEMTSQQGAERVRAELGEGNFGVGVLIPLIHTRAQKGEA